MARRKNQTVGYTIAPEASAPPAPLAPASCRLRPLKIGRDPDSSEVAIESVVEVDERQWRNVFQNKCEEDSALPSAKRRKTSPASYETEKSEEAGLQELDKDDVVLVNREISFVIPSKHVPPVFEEIVPDDAQNKWTAVAQSFRAPFPPGKRVYGTSSWYDGHMYMFSSCFKINSSTLSEATKTDLYWVWRVDRGVPLFGEGGSKARIHVQLRRHGRRGLALVLNIQLVTKTVDGWDALTLRASNELYTLTSQAFPNGAPVTNRGRQISVPEFYNSLYIPDKDTVVPANIQPSTLNCELMPFQQRAVQWMLRREGVDLGPNAEALMPYDPRNELDVPLTFFKNADKAGQTVYVSHILGVITKSLAVARECLQQLRGGILAEEMGLGKTVEIIALLSLHKREFAIGDKTDFEGRKIQVTGSTLIVCPNSILQQWISEIRNHAPSMKVFHYKGLKSSFKDSSNQEIMDELIKYDIILTTYAVLSSEVHYAAPPSSRSLRTQKKYVARRSPLVEMSWWRVCLDEAQMALGYSQAAEVAHKIPRINAWAVSGTPIKSDLQDCYGLLQFFQLEPFCYHKDVFSRLLDYNQEAFKAMFRSFTLRHSKDIVRDELRLPPQNRVVVSVPFTQVEQQNYDGLFAQMCQETFVNEFGEPLSDEWGDDEEVKKLYQIQRRFLIRLRQSCLHPEAGAQNRRALGGKDGPIRSVDEVLDVMIDQLASKMRSDERELFVSMVKLGQLHVEEDRPQAAMDVWMNVLPMIQKAVAECREELAKEIRDLETSGSAQEKGKQRQENPGEEDRDVDISDWDEIDDSEEEDEDADRRSKKNRIAIARMRLRNFLEVEHACLYWIATGYHQLGQAHAKSGREKERTEEEQKAFDGTTSEYTTKEEEFYGAAQKVRRELMTDTRTRALKYMGDINERSNENHPKRFIDVPDIDPIPEVGLQAHRVLGNIDQLADALNSQAIILDEWREKLCQLLQTQLFDQEVEEGTNEGKGEGNRGDEHEEAVVLQDQCYTYILALRALIADRHAALTGEQNLFISEETQRALDTPDKIQADLFWQLLTRKDENVQFGGLGDVRHHLSELRTLVNGLKADGKGGNGRAASEAQLAEPHLRTVQTMLSEHTKICQTLFREVEFLRGALNARMDFYRQLQAVSDTLLPIDIVKEYNKVRINEALFAQILESEQWLSRSITRDRARMRFLDHIRAAKTQNATNPECLICLSPYQTGVMTTCGHSFCKFCIDIWLKTSKTCPECRFSLNHPSCFFPVTYKIRETKMLQESNSANVSPPSKKSLSGRGVSGGIFVSADDALVRAIKGIKLTTSYGSKIDMITRHLVYLQRAIPGAKAVIFSQWSDVLDIIKLAFTSAGIRYSSLQTEDRVKRRGPRRGVAASGPSNPARRGFNTDVTVTGGWAGGVDDFKSDSSITCFLLHAKSQSAGLTLVNATHVFLCEPLVNIPLELQAINRVHRIGQTKPTTVWLYTVQGTVEEGVLEVSTRKRLEMIGKKRDSIDTHGDESHETIEGSKTKAKGKGKVRERGKEKEENEAMAATGHDGEISMADLDKVHSLELKDSVAGLVEHAPGGGEVVMDHDLWTCLFSTVQRKNAQEGADGMDVGARPGVMDDGGLGQIVEMEVRREVMAGAAERRAANSG